jgi:hypothetical protein
MKEESTSRLPRPVTPAPALLPAPFSIPRSRQKFPPKLKRFLTRDTNTTAWDPDDMFASMERVMSESLGKLQQNTQESSSMKELLDMYKARCKSFQFSTKPFLVWDDPSILIAPVRSGIGKRSGRTKFSEPNPPNRARGH